MTFLRLDNEAINLLERLLPAAGKPVEDIWTDLKRMVFAANVVDGMTGEGIQDRAAVRLKKLSHGVEIATDERG